MHFCVYARRGRFYLRGQRLPCLGDLTHNTRDLPYLLPRDSRVKLDLGKRASLQNHFFVRAGHQARQALTGTGAGGVLCKAVYGKYKKRAGSKNWQPDAPTGAPTNATDAPTPSIVRRRALLEKGSSFIDESVWFQRALAADKSGVVQSLRDIWGY